VIVSSGSSIDNFVIRPAAGQMPTCRGPEGSHEAASRLGALIRRGPAPSGADPAAGYCVTVIVPTKPG